MGLTLKEKEWLHVPEVPREFNEKLVKTVAGRVNDLMAEAKLSSVGVAERRELFHKAVSSITHNFPSRVFKAVEWKENYYKGDGGRFNAKIERVNEVARRHNIDLKGLEKLFRAKSYNGAYKKGKWRLAVLTWHNHPEVFAWLSG